jgi:hypothetical protein
MVWFTAASRFRQLSQPTQSIVTVNVAPRTGRAENAATSAAFAAREWQNNRKLLKTSAKPAREAIGHLANSGGSNFLFALQD